MTKDALVRDLDLADKLGSLDTQGLAEMERRKAPTLPRRLPGTRTFAS